MLKTATQQTLLLILLSLVVNACTLISPRVTKAKYDQVQTGMTLSQVQDIIGKPGELTTEISVPTGGSQAFYHWKNPDGSSMTAIFLNGKLVLKNQINLK
jgi:outer membrane protein assembly factor BamE (lipoprotein component of BamABCDE complex)